jgi:hypothetical protein
VTTKLATADLQIEPVGRPDPAAIRMEVLAAQPLIAAYADGKAEREKTVDDAVKAINFGALEQGNEQAFDESLKQAQAKLQELNPWLKQFTIKAVGNSHIDMA